MPIFSLKKSNQTTLLKKATAAIKNGGVIICPTDTLYGLSADPLNQLAYKKIFQIKERDLAKPLSLIFSSLSQVKKYALINKKAERLINSLLPGPFTFLLPQKKNSPLRQNPYFKKAKKIGVRIPHHPFCLKIAQSLRRPITTTSINSSGKKALIAQKAIKKFIEKQNAQPDLLIFNPRLEKRISFGMASTIIDLTTIKPVVIRADHKKDVQKLEKTVNQK